MNEILESIIHPSIGHFNAAVLTLLVYFMKRFIEGQEETNKSLKDGHDKICDKLIHIGERIHETQEEIAVAQEKVVSLEERERLRERMNENRHAENQKVNDRLWSAVNKLQERKA